MRTLLGAAVLVPALLLAHLAVALPIYSGPAGKAEAHLAAGLAQAAAAVPGGEPVTPTVTGGSVDNLQQLLATTGDGLALARADVARAAWLGTGRFQSPHPDLRALAVLHTSYLAVLTRQDLGEVRQLRGKRVAVSPAATGDREALLVLLEHAGVARAAVPVQITADPLAALHAGQVDAAFVVVAPDDVSLTAALAAGDRWLSLPTAKELPESAWPWQVATVDRAQFQQLGDKKVVTLSVPQVLIGRSNLPRLAVDDLVEAMWGQPDLLRQGDRGLAGIQRALAAMPSPLPLHPGAADAYARGGPLDKPIDVRVTVWLIAISAVDLQKGTFNFDATIELRWLDPRLGPEDPRPFEVMNADEVEVTPNGYEPHGPWHSLNWRMHGRARSQFDLHAYPFDAQRFELAFEHPLLQYGQLVFHCETRWHPEAGLTLDQRLGPGFSLQDWQLQAVRSEEVKAKYGPTEFFSRYNFVVEVRREVLRFAVADLAPLLLMVLMALAASLIPAEKLDGKLLLTVLALLCSVELQVNAAGHLPEVGYLTVVDWSYFAAYASIGLATLQVIGEYRAHARGRDDVAARLRKWGVLATVAAFALPLAWMLLVRRVAG
ncbi:MAG: TAXI family TRAP transporter solute-binding subunit [Deltaproteobacteria bacterium]|nr:TAXI family TRAP transporter solute-binding subunit [Deltaproteobacteria bacterium]